MGISLFSVHDYILPIYLYLTVDILFNMAHESVSSSPVSILLVQETKEMILLELFLP